MKLGDIKAAALKLMFASYDRDITAETVDSLRGDAAFRDYLYNMPQAINRAFGIIENKRVLPERTVDYLPNGSNHIAVPLTVEAVTGAPGGEFKRVIYSACGRINWVPFTDYVVSDGEVILPSVVAGEAYRVCYAPRLARITAETSDLMEIPIPDDVAALIPYFVKGDLYREEDAAEASNARNWFDAGLEEIECSRIGMPSGVATVFGGMI